MASVWVGILSLIARYGVSNYFVAMYIVPGVIGGNMHSLRKYIEHMGLTGSTILSSTRSIVSQSFLGRLAAFSLFNIQFHGVHHKYAKIPQARLPEFVPLLAPTQEGELA